MKASQSTAIKATRGGLQIGRKFQQHALFRNKKNLRIEQKTHWIRPEAAKALLQPFKLHSNDQRLCVSLTSFSILLTKKRKMAYAVEIGTLNQTSNHSQ